MSGTRLANMRAGDRSEYLAVYLLSALGLVTQVPRQEDIGFDLICNLAEQESKILSFRHHYAVSVKSASSPTVVLDPPESKENDPEYTSHFDWLFHLELPLLLAVVDKKQQSLSLYSTLPAWFLYHEKPKECGIIELVPRIKEDGNNPDVGQPEDCGVEAKAGGRRRYKVDLGFPIATINSKDLNDKEAMLLKKTDIRLAIQLGSASSRLAQMKTPFFWWIHKTRPKGGVGDYAFIVDVPKNIPQLEEMMGSLAPGLMAAALLFKAANQQALLHSVGETLKILPSKSIPPLVREHLAEVFPPTPR